jgi:hypothetical protein
VTVSTDLLARVWLMDLRRKSFSEMGGTTRTREIWRNVQRRIATDVITDRGVPVRVTSAQAEAVKQKAFDLVKHCVTADAHTEI